MLLGQIDCEEKEAIQRKFSFAACLFFVSYCFRDYCTIVCFYFERTTLEISVLHFSVILSCYPWNCLDFVLFILNFTHGTETKYVF